MNFEDIINVISQTAFPIAACVVMWRYLTTVTAELKKSIDSNTLAIVRMLDKVEEVANNDKNLE